MPTVVNVVPVSEKKTDIEVSMTSNIFNVKTPLSIDTESDIYGNKKSPNVDFPKFPVINK